MAGEITGTVVDPDGNGIQDVVVVFEDAAPNDHVISTRTDAAGDYQQSLPADTYDVVAQKVGSVAEEEELVNVSENETVTVNFTLSELPPKVVGEVGSSPLWGSSAASTTVPGRQSGSGARSTAATASACSPKAARGSTARQNWNRSTAR